MSDQVKKELQRQRGRIDRALRRQVNVDILGVRVRFHPYEETKAALIKFSPRVPGMGELRITDKTGITEGKFPNRQISIGYLTVGQLLREMAKDDYQVAPNQTVDVATYTAAWWRKHHQAKKARPKKSITSAA